MEEVRRISRRELVAWSSVVVVPACRCGWIAVWKVDDWNADAAPEKEMMMEEAIANFMVDNYCVGVLGRFGSALLFMV